MIYFEIQKFSEGEVQISFQGEPTDTSYSLAQVEEVFNELADGGKNPIFVANWLDTDGFVLIVLKRWMKVSRRPTVFVETARSDFRQLLKLTLEEKVIFVGKGEER